MPERTTTFTNCRVCRAGQLVHEDLLVSHETGQIVDSPGESEVVNLGGAIIAPGFIELQTNGMKGFHFTHFEDGRTYTQKIDEIARYLPSTGCTGFYATVPTVSSHDFKKVNTPVNNYAVFAAEGLFYRSCQLSRPARSLAPPRCLGLTPKAHIFTRLKKEPTMLLSSMQLPPLPQKFTETCRCLPIP